MRFPLPVLDLDEPGRAQWAEHFADGHDRRRDVEEGIWRRTQDPRNADQSGWTEAESARRRIVHYWNRYAVDGDTLVLAEWYLYYCVTYPAAEIDAYLAQVHAWLAAGGWTASGAEGWARGDLRAHLTRYDEHPEDAAAGRATPDGFASLQVRFASAGLDLPVDVAPRPWQVLAGGMRIKDRRGTPTLIDTLAPLAQYTPFQVEVGCGVSVEAGVPPLHRLHEVYRVTTRGDNKPGAADAFVMRPDDDRLLAEVLLDPEKKFGDFTELYRKCFQARPTPALKALDWLAREGHLIGPVITNNFDTLAARAGLQECFVRRYDQQIPDVPFLPETKALLVVGNHADRRAVEARARAAGLKVFFCDPEGFYLEDGTFAPYPLEGAADGDYVCRQTAAEGLPELVRVLQNAQVETGAEVARAA